MLGVLVEGTIPFFFAAQIEVLLKVLQRNNRFFKKGYNLQRKDYL